MPAAASARPSAANAEKSAMVKRGWTTSWPRISLSVIGRPSGCSASISRTCARTGLSSRFGSPAVRSARVRWVWAISVYGTITIGEGSARRPAFRVLAITPTMVTSGGRVVSAIVRAGGCSSSPSRTRAPIGFSPAGHSFAAASLTTATRSPRRTSDASNIRPPRSGMPKARRWSAPTRLIPIRFESSATCPAIANDDCGPPNGRPNVAASTPGSALTRSSRSCAKRLR